MTQPTDLFAVIMAGGSGTRFWPLSRGAMPKQLLGILGGPTMIQATVARLQPLIPPERVLIVTTAALADETRRQLPMLKPEHVIAEPVGRDTAACVCLAAVVIERLHPGATMVLLPADQVIQPADAFQRALAVGAALAAQRRLVTYGIAPRFPATGYGYIRVGAALPGSDGVGVNQVERFVEKPDEATARGYVAEGTYRWNAGIFCWRSDVVLGELEQHCPWLTAALAPLAEHWGRPDFASVLDRIYQPLRKISIDYALMEKARDIVVVTGDFAWDDLGSWDALYDHLPRDAAGVITHGRVLALECQDSLVYNTGAQTVVAHGLSGITVVATADAILIQPKGRSQEVKKAVDALKNGGRADLL
jgi:mannose-1-phosphate guanylyltransferase